MARLFPTQVKLTHIPLVGTRIRVFWDGTEDLHASFARTAETLTFDAATDVRKPLMVVYQALGSDNDSINTEEPASSPTANNVARAAMDREAQRLNTNNGLGQSGININAARVNPVGDSAGRVPRQASAQVIDVARSATHGERRSLTVVNENGPPKKARPYRHKEWMGLVTIR